MDNLLSEYGFKIIKKQYFEDHSIFYSAEKIDKKVKVNYNNYNINKKILVIILDIMKKLFQN